MFRNKIMLAIFLVVLVNIPSTAAADVFVGSKASDLAVAMGVNPLNLVSSTIGMSDPYGVGVSNGALNAFPTNGNTFTILSTGLAASANTANIAKDTSYTLGGVNFSNQDMVQLTMVLKPPAGATNLKFDFAFFSEEFPEYIGSSFNDVFVAELAAEPSTSKITFINGEINSPNNIAFDPNHQAISVNAAFGFDPNNPNPNTGTTYDGTSGMLRATGCLPKDRPTGNVVLTLSLMDLGDSLYDSAVFLDNFQWDNSAECSSGAEEAGDAFIRDNDTDTGAEPSQGAWWQTPDIWVRHQNDGATTTNSQELLLGKTVYLYANVRNTAEAVMKNVKVEFYWVGSNLAPSWSDWNLVGSTTIPELPIDGTQIVSLPWAVPAFLNGAHHACLQVRISSSQDPLQALDVPWSNNIAQRNVNIMRSCDAPGNISTVEDDVRFMISNPFTQTAKKVDLSINREYFHNNGVVELTLDATLFNNWVASGGTVEGGYIVAGQPKIVINTNGMGFIRQLPLAAGQQVAATMHLKAGQNSYFSVAISEIIEGKYVGGNVYTAGCGPKDVRPPHVDVAIDHAGDIWASPNIWVRHQPDGYTTSQELYLGQTAYLYAKIFNRGTLPITKVKAEFYYNGNLAGSNLAPAWGDWKYIGATEALNLEINGERVVYVPWEVPVLLNGAHHACLQVRLTAVGDEDATPSVKNNNNIAQRNVHIVRSCDNPGNISTVADDMPIVVSNPFTHSAKTVDLAVNREFFHALGSVEISFESAVFEGWLANGGTVEGGVINATDHKVTITANKMAFIRGLKLQASQQVTATMKIKASTNEYFSVAISEIIDGEYIGGNVYTAGCAPGEKPAPVVDVAIPDGGAEWWANPNIWVRHQPDGKTNSQELLLDQTVYVYAKVSNVGNLPIDQIKAEFYYHGGLAGSNLAPAWNDWKYIGATQVSELKVGEQRLVYVAWKVPALLNGSHHACLQVRLTTAKDLGKGNLVKGNNNIAQTNRQIIRSCDAPGNISTVNDLVGFEIGNPFTNTAKMVDVAVNREFFHAEGTIEIFLDEAFFTAWRAQGGTVEGGQVDDAAKKITMTAPQMGFLRKLPLAAGQQVSATLRIKATTNQYFSVAVSEIIDGEYVGGNVYTAGCAPHEAPDNGNQPPIGEIDPNHPELPWYVNGNITINPHPVMQGQETTLTVNVDNPTLVNQNVSIEFYVSGLGVGQWWTKVKTLTNVELKAASWTKFSATWFPATGGHYCVAVKIIGPNNTRWLQRNLDIGAAIGGGCNTRTFQICNPFNTVKTFELKATKLSGLAGSTAQLGVDKVTLAPGGCTTTEINICVPETPCQKYSYVVEPDPGHDGVMFEIEVPCVNQPPQKPANVVIRDNPTDNGSIPSQGAHWISPDIIARQQPDGGKIAQPLKPGEKNYFYITTRNIGDVVLDDVIAELYIANPSVGLSWPNDWHKLGQTAVGSLFSQQEKTVMIAAEVPTAYITGDHACTLVRLVSVKDPIKNDGNVPFDNNLAQRNMHILRSCDNPGNLSEVDGSYAFWLQNPSETVAKTVDLEVSRDLFHANGLVEVYLGDDLFNRWVANGSKVEGGTVDVANKKIAITANTKGYIRNISLEAGESIKLKIRIKASANSYFAVGVSELLNGQYIDGSVFAAGCAPSSLTIKTANGYPVKYTGDLGDFTGSISVNPLGHGSYTLKQTPTTVPGSHPTLVGVTCVNDAGWPTNVAKVDHDDFTATITLDPGTQLVCTFLNESAGVDATVTGYSTYLPLITK